MTSVLRGRQSAPRTFVLGATILALMLGIAFVGTVTTSGPALADEREADVLASPQPQWDRYKVSGVNGDAIIRAYPLSGSQIQYTLSPGTEVWAQPQKIVAGECWQNMNYSGNQRQFTRCSNLGPT